MKRTLHFHVGKESSGQRLDELLAARITLLSRLHLKRLLAQGACTINGVAERAGYRVRAGDWLEIVYDEAAPNAMTPQPLPLKIHYEDEHLLVVDKPAGMLVHPTRGVKSGTLANALTYHLNSPIADSEGLRIDTIADWETQSEEARVHDEAHTADNSPLANPQCEFRNPQSIRPGIVHRLDRATSGLMVIAKTQRALSRLTNHFQRRLVEKRYLAVVCGLVAEDEMVIEAPIGRSSDAPPHWGVVEGGKIAETRLRVLERSAGLTLVELEPVTGRTNQLRIHCAHARHPILGDEWYGAIAAPRLCLHAARLAFFHPARDEWMEFTSPLPDEITNT